MIASSKDLSTTLGEPPGTGPDHPHRRPWYKRWPLWAGVVAVVLVASVISDLPQHASNVDQADAAASIMTEINTDIHPCAYAVTQAFSIYHGVVSGTLSASDRRFIPGYLHDDQQACSYADTAIFGMSTITVPDSAAGRDLGNVITTVLEWSTSDGVGAIVDIETLVNHPGDAAARRDLSRRARRLESDRALAEAERLHAVQALGAHVPFPALVLPRVGTAAGG